MNKRQLRFHELLCQALVCSPPPRGLQELSAAQAGVSQEDDQVPLFLESNPRFDELICHLQLPLLCLLQHFIPLQTSVLFSWVLELLVIIFIPTLPVWNLTFLMALQRSFTASFCLKNILRCPSWGFTAGLQWSEGHESLGWVLWRILLRVGYTLQHRYNQTFSLIFRSVRISPVEKNFVARSLFSLLTKGP